MVNDEPYWNITFYYGIFLALNFALAFLLYRAWRDHLRTWKIQDSRWQIALLLLATILISVATLVLAFTFFATYESWRSALNPATPAPMFELFWIFGVFAVTVPAGFAGMLQKFVRKEFDDLMP